jgi:hypothetical protein
VADSCEYGDEPSGFCSTDLVIIKTIIFILSKVYLVYVQKVLLVVLVTHQVAPPDQCHSVHKNESDDHVFLFPQYIVTNIVVKIVNIFFHIIIRCVTLFL